MAMLEVNHLAIQFGGLRAVDGFNVSIEKGQLYGLIGPNGAGKTTIFNLLTGVYKPTEGIIKLDGQDITGKSTIEINKAGIARTFQNIRLFKDMPVLDNVKVGLHNHHSYSTLTGIIPAKAGSIIYEGKNLTKTPAHKIVEMGMAHVPEGRRVFADMSVYENLLMGAYTRKDKNEIAQSLEMVYKRFPRLKERTGQRAGTLSGGEQQMLAMGRALMSKPKIILMDEPSMGLSPIFVNEIFDIIKEVSESGTTVLLVEQNAKKALSIADRAYVLETGSITLEGKADDLLHDESVQKAYLGE